ncbi:hypothetical protein IL306_002437 [Fusarium sp. DS 682]|nr:hypothetical protein IL306_002437 [Fusarium sp. DS 682]
MRLYETNIIRARPTQITYLESAVFSPQQHKHYGQDDPFQLAGILAQKITLNHAYQDGNKRTSLLAANEFLRMNGYQLREELFPSDEIDDKITAAHVAVATKQWDAEKLAAFYKSIATGADDMASNQGLREAIEHTSRQFFASYIDAGESNDASIINRNVDKDCKRYYRPLTLLDFFGVPSDFAHENDAYEGGIANNLKKGAIKTCQVSNMTIDVKARKSAATTKSDMVFKDGEVLVMEHAWILDFNEDGSKVVKVLEFCDQSATRRMVMKVYLEKFGETH